MFVNFTLVAEYQLTMDSRQRHIPLALIAASKQLEGTISATTRTPVRSMTYIPFLLSLIHRVMQLKKHNFSVPPFLALLSYFKPTIRLAVHVTPSL